MNLSHYEDVHPNWNLIRSLDQTQSEAALDLLTTATLVDGDLTTEEFDTLSDELQQLPFVAGARETVFPEELEKTVSRIRSFEQSPDRFEEFLRETCSKITSDEIQMSVLRLLAIDITLEEPTEAQQDLFYATGLQWDYDYDTLEHVLKAAWESHEETRDFEQGDPHHVPPVQGTNRARDRTQKPAPNPFTQRMKT